MEKSLPRAGYLISRISRLGQRWLDVRLKHLSIATAAVPVLAMLEEEGVCTQRDLAIRIGIEQSTMAQLLRRMERDNLIVRVPNPKDARSAHVSLTERAFLAFPAARHEIEKGYSLIASEFSERELATLVALLGRYLTSLEKQMK